MKFKFAFFVIAVFNTLIIAWGLSKTFFEDQITARVSIEKPGQLHLTPILLYHTTQELDSIFPKKKFIDSIDYENALQVDKTIQQTLSLIKGDTLETYRFFVKNLLEPIISRDTLKTYDPAILLSQLNAGVSYKSLGIINPNATLYADAIADQYFQLVSMQLTKFQERKPDLVNQFNFQYLVQRLGEYNYYPNRKETSADKFLKTFLENDYFHLVNTSWQKSSIAQKIILFIFFGFFIFGIISAFSIIIKRIKN
jgi:hypothetical protein